MIFLIPLLPLLVAILGALHAGKMPVDPRHRDHWRRGQRLLWVAYWVVTTLSLVACFFFLWRSA